MKLYLNYYQGLIDLIVHDYHSTLIVLNLYFVIVQHSEKCSPLLMYDFLYIVIDFFSYIKNI